MPSVRDQIRQPSLTPAEAREFHYQALVIDAQQPPTTSGFLFNDNMRAALAVLHEQGYTQREARAQMARMAAREVQTNPAAAKEYIDLWHTSGVTVGAGTYTAGTRIEVAFEDAVKGIAEARSMIDSLDGELKLVLKADDIEQASQTSLAHRNGDGSAGVGDDSAAGQALSSAQREATDPGVTHLLLHFQHQLLAVQLQL